MSDLETAERALRRFLQVFPSSADREGAFFESGLILKHLTEYNRQYIGFVVGNSRRILINGYLRDEPFAECERYGFIQVMDGGYGFWQVIYDVDSGKFVSFHSNGYASAEQAVAADGHA